MSLPATQRAVQLVGPDRLVLNEAKPVYTPGPYQILAKVEVTGLCFSDLKLLKQFSRHVRKSEIVSTLSPATLAEIPSYVPGEKPTVPGHETVVRIVAVGRRVTIAKPGDRRLVQTDYRWLRTAESCAAFGYNFEGALQEYVLMDERAIVSPEGESMLLPAADDLAASAIALVEPWACVEDSCVVRERRGPKPDGAARTIDSATFTPADAAAIPDASLDDIVFLGAKADVLEAIFPKLAKNGLLAIAQRGEKFGRPVITPVGRIHYSGVRIAGTAESNPAEAYAAIPESGEIRPGDIIHIIGAAGPMGMMHTIRAICRGVPNVRVLGGDVNDERLAQLRKIAVPFAAKYGVPFEAYHAKANPPAGPFGYIVLMAPEPSLVAQAVAQAAPRAIINIFAGLPAAASHPIDLDAYIAKQAYFIGTSGSTVEDMRNVLKKVADRSLDTNLSVAAISGLDGAIDGIRAVERQTIAGKIIVYPSCKGLPLTRLTELHATHPGIAAKLCDGIWTREAELALLAMYA